MASARVELTGCVSHTARGRTFRKNQPQTLTNPADILYYQSQQDFSVIVLDDAPPAKTKAKIAAPAKPKEPVKDDDEGEGDDEEPEDDEDDESEDDDDDEVTLPPKSEPAKSSKPVVPSKPKAK